MNHDIFLNKILKNGSFMYKYRLISTRTHIRDYFHLFYNIITVSGPVKGLRMQALGPDRLHVTWSAPSDPRGQITGYLIRHRQVGIGDCDDTVHSWSGWLTVTTMYHTIHELQPYHQYEVMVSPRNGFGVGEPTSTKAYTTQSGTAICHNIIRASALSY